MLDLDWQYAICKPRYSFGMAQEYAVPFAQCLLRAFTNKDSCRVKLVAQFHLAL
jgi:hypothetical protein